MGTVRNDALDQPLTVVFLMNQLTHSLTVTCVRSVDSFVHKIIHRHSTVIPSGFSTGFDNPRRRAVRPRAIPGYARRHAARWCDRARQTRRQSPEDCASSILSPG